MNRKGNYKTAQDFIQKKRYIGSEITASELLI